jgi:hypothetical protein
MAGAIDDLLNHLGGTREGDRPEVTRFPALDTGQLVGDLRLNQRAQELGKQ